jgi:predicted HTH transcriptional regulator
MSNEEILRSAKMYLRDERTGKEGDYSHRSETVNVKYEDEILMLIQENPKITMSEMAQFLAVTKRTVERIMSNVGLSVHDKCVLQASSYFNGMTALPVLPI